MAYSASGHIGRTDGGFDESERMVLRQFLVANSVLAVAFGPAMSSFVYLSKLNDSCCGAPGLATGMWKERRRE